MNNSYVTLNVADGTTMQAYTALPDNVNENTPAIIVFQEAFGVNGHIRKVTDRFAGEGYIAIAPELFHRTAPVGFEGDYSDFAAVMPHYSALTREGMQADITAAFNWLNTQEADKSRIFSVGYCLGGRASFLANATVPLAAAVSYYGGGTDGLLDLADQLSGKHLFFWGGLDTHIPKETVDKITEALTYAGKPYANVVFSDANHAFNCDERPSFNPAASKESWALTLEFLRNN
jgi:carboxymethylenebutenolidase